MDIGLTPVPSSVEYLTAEIDRLRRWKEEALPRLTLLHELHCSLPPGCEARLGHSMDAAVLAFVRRQADCYPQSTTEGETQ